MKCFNIFALCLLTLCVFREISSQGIDCSKATIFLQNHKKCMEALEKCLLTPEMNAEECAHLSFWLAVICMDKKARKCRKTLTNVT